MLFSIIWILFAAWAISIFFYFLRIKKIARSNGVPLFSTPARYNKTIRSLVKNLYFRILIATIIFIVTVVIAYFVEFSSEQ
jgi:hypothetical protein